MEVNATSFPHDLLDMLVAIAEAQFVSFDLELSGIPSRLQGRPRNSARQTLEERYLEAKQGAEKHQILQVGFTCARFDYIANRYVLRPYNINISPLIDERLDIEREFSFQSGAIAFLLKCGFQLDAPFKSGVQYLSREEAEQAKRKAYDRIDDKKVFEDLQLKETDIESLDFLERVRAGITRWKTGRDASSLVITTHTGLDDQPDEPAITRFEKRLVYQLLRAEYPDLRVIGKQDSMRIIPFDADREEENRKRMKARVKDQIARQTGFRWIVEALARGRIDGLHPLYFAQSRSGLAIAADLNNIKNKLNKATMGLQTNQPVLVGHNMFTDLVYFYRCFIGELPETLQQFSEAVHELFPRIVDTKYLATHDGGDLNASPTLQSIDASLSVQELPEISKHKVPGMLQVANK
jgi:poly(A)-specific ribonuclease